MAMDRTDVRSNSLLCCRSWISVQFRSCKAIVVLTPGLRKRYMRYFSNQAMQRQGAMLITTTVVIWVSTTAFPLCYTPSL
jgi:hypothetical protein